MLAYSLNITAFVKLVLRVAGWLQTFRGADVPEVVLVKWSNAVPQSKLHYVLIGGGLPVAHT